MVSEAVLIRNARHWRTGETIDLAWSQGLILPRPPRDADRVFDARGAVVAPGLVDAHVHLREPGQGAKETIETGTRAAAAGGFTDVLCMPNTEPALDSPAWIEWVRFRAREAGHCRVHPIGAVTVSRRGEKLTEFMALKAAGAVALSDDGSPIVMATMMRRALEHAREAGLVIIAHEEDPTLGAAGPMNEGPTATRLGIPGAPCAAESVMVRRDAELAELTRGRVHVAHASCAQSLDAVRDAKRRGLPVTVETCPHYWTLTDEAVGDYDTRAKMNPPLRSEADRQSVILAIADGTIDCLVTDHAPHTEEEKRQGFERAPFGIVGLETALGLTITHLVEPGHISLTRALELWTDAPRRLFGLPKAGLAAGESADLTLIDPGSRWTVERSRFYSKGRNTPFEGWRLSGKVMLTVLEGRVTHLDPELVTAGAMAGPVAAFGSGS